MSSHTIAGIDAPFESNNHVPWSIDAAGTIQVHAEPLTDIFVDPNATNPNGVTLNAATLLTSAPAGDWQLTAKVTVDFQAKFDAGVLLVWYNEDYWAKLCFEYNPKGEATVVSVVNRLISDDANGPVINGNTVWLRVSKTDNVTCFHTSTDGNTWDLLRVFDLAYNDQLPHIGLEAQSPTGQGVDITFENVTLTQTRLLNQRDGS